MLKPRAKASQPTIVAMSWTRVLVSLALVDAERSWLSFARTQGCVEIWTLVEDIAIAEDCLCSERERVSIQSVEG